MFKKLRERRAEKKRQAAARRKQYIVDRATLQDQAPFLWAAPEEPQYKTKSVNNYYSVGQNVPMSIQV